MRSVAGSRDEGFQGRKNPGCLAFPASDVLKRNIPPGILAGLNSLFQWTGALWQFTPSVFIKSMVARWTEQDLSLMTLIAFFKCPECGHSPLVDQGERLFARHVVEVGRFWMAFTIFAGKSLK